MCLVLVVTSDTVGIMRVVSISTRFVLGSSIGVLLMLAACNGNEGPAADAATEDNGTEGISSLGHGDGDPGDGDGDGDGTPGDGD